MINDLLDYTRSSFGGFPHNPKPTDLQSVCDAAIDELRATHPDRSITRTVAGDVTGTWDPGRLQQAISNLVGNALEHSTGAVSVRIEGDGHDVVLCVHNDGEPISPDILPVLFEPFRRGDRSPNGLGPGLFIVREVIRSHGGTIEVSPSGEAGTVFVSRWPRQPNGSRRTVVDQSANSVTLRLPGDELPGPSWSVARAALALVASPATIFVARSIHLRKGVSVRVPGGATKT